MTFGEVEKRDMPDGPSDIETPVFKTASIGINMVLEKVKGDMSIRAS